MHPSPGQSTADSSNVMIVSVNGGAHYQNQSESMEIAFYRKSTGTLEMFDVDVKSKKPVMSAKNPELCLQCHGDDAKTEKGARPIFDPFGSWPRFVGGAVRCFGAEDKLQLHQQKLALEALRENPRFRCLDKSGLEDDLKKVALRPNDGPSPFRSTGAFEGFDGFLFEVNNLRIARLVKATPDYQAYKFAIVGAEECADDMFENLERWIPPAILARHNRLTTVDPEAARVRDPKDLRAMIAAAREAGRKYREAAEKNLVKDLANPQAGLNPAAKPFICQNPGLADAEKYIEELAGELPKYKNPVLRAYAIDQAFRRKPLEIRGATSPLARFLFEGRGIDMGYWAMEPTPGEYRIGFSIAASLRKLEPPFGELTAIWKKHENTVTGINLMDGGIHEEEDRFCKDLREASYRNLLRLPGGTLPAPPPAESAR
jgi:hypothetical protein